MTARPGYGEGSLTLAYGVHIWPEGGVQEVGVHELLAQKLWHAV